MSPSRRLRSLCSALLLVAPASLLATASAWSASPPPDLGAYQEPAPPAPKEKHATAFVNELLEHRGERTRVSTRDLRGGVVLTEPAVATQGRSKGASTSRPPKALPRPPKTTPARGRLPAPDPGPAQRAGLVTPGNQDVPGELIGLLVAAVFAAAGIVLELSRRRRNA